MDDIYNLCKKVAQLPIFINTSFQVSVQISKLLLYNKK